MYIYIYKDSDRSLLFTAFQGQLCRESGKSEELTFKSPPEQPPPNRTAIQPRGLIRVTLGLFIKTFRRGETSPSLLTWLSCQLSAFVSKICSFPGSAREGGLWAAEPELQKNHRLPFLVFTYEVASPKTRTDHSFLQLCNCNCVKKIASPKS